MGGMITSFTRDVTIVLNAAPMMIPTAMSTTLPRMANSLNSFINDISAPPCAHYILHVQAHGR